MFKPLNNRVLVKAIEKPKNSGFDLPESKEKPVMGIVVVGNKDVEKGDEIFFSKFGFDEILIDEETHYVVSDFNILGIL